MSTYSTSLKLTLIGDGEQAGTWGQTTNTNLGTLLEEAIVGTASIVMADANYTLTNLNGVSDEARKAALIVSGANTAIRDIITPTGQKKLYIVKNGTSGGYAIRIKTSGGAAVTIPNGITTTVFCDGTDFFEQKTGTNGNFSIGGALSGATATFSGAISSVSPTFTGTPTAPTAANGTNTTQIATTAFVQTAVTGATGALGTMSTQNANNVAITGGTISGATVNSNVVGSNSTGAKTISASTPTGGSDGDVWYQI